MIQNYCTGIGNRIRYTLGFGTVSVYCVVTRLTQEPCTVSTHYTVGANSNRVMTQYTTQFMMPTVS